MRVNDIVALAGFLLLSFLAGAIGSVFTIQSIPDWYAFLDKPFFSPPNWVFGPVWTALYALMGISAYIVYEKAGKAKAAGALSMFGIQLGFNTLWSLLFFGLRSPFLGLVCIVALWLSIAVMISRFHAISKIAGYLMVPYILWVSFAGVLNFFVWMMN
jgi:benzodiazapine receptor